MPVRGENVGSAYIRIYADGGTLGESIKDELDDLDSDFAEGGRRHGELYSTEMDREIEKQRPGARAVRRVIAKEGQRSRTVARDFGATFGVEFRRGLEKEVGKTIGRRMYDLIQRDVIRAGSFEAVFREIRDKETELTEWRLANFGSYLQRATEELEREEAKRARITEQAEAERMRNTEREARERERLERRETEARRAAEIDRLRVFAEASRERLRIMEREYEQLNAMYRNSADRTTRDMLAARRERIAEMRKEVRDAEDAWDNYEDTYVSRERRITRALRREVEDRTRINADYERGMNRMSRALFIIAPGVGRAFGRGSRNDLVNFFGAFVENATKLVGVLSDLPQMALNLSKRFGVFFSSMKNGAGFTQSLSNAFGRFALSLPAMAAGIAVVVGVLGTLTALLSSLIGVVVALANVISFALVGSLAALAGTLLPVAAGIGVLIAGVVSLSDEQKKALQTAIKPFTNGLKEIGKAAARGLLDAENNGERLKTTIKNMTTALKTSGLKNLVEEIGNAIGNVGLGWSEALKSPGFKAWNEAMAKTLPGQVEKLGKITQNVVEGLGGTFLAMQPLVDRFLTWLEKITDEWSEFANSVEGQEKMISFFDRAGDSARELGGFLKELGGLFKDLLFSAEGNDAGVSIFNDMEGAIKRFREYIKGDNLQQWFKDAKDTAETFGRVLKDIAKILDTLDSPGFRNFARLVLKVFEEGFESVNNFLKPITDLVEMLDRLVHLDFGGAGEALGAFLASIGTLILDVVTLGFADEIIEAFKGLGWDSISGFFAGMGEFFANAYEWVSEQVSKLVGIFKQLLGIQSPSTVFMQIGRDVVLGLALGIGEGIVSLLGMVGEFVGQLAGVFVDIFTKTFETITDNALAFVEWITDKIGSGFDFLIGKAQAVANFFLGPLSSAWGTIKTKASELGSWISSKLSSAFSGLWTAADKVAGFFRGAFTKAIDGIIGTFGKLRDSVGWVIDKLGSLANLIRKPFKIKIDMPNIAGRIAGALVPKMASGALVSGPTHALIGEAGPEAVVPLDRPLSQVDPAVRWLSAIAQGLTPVPAPNMSGAGGRTVNVGDLTIVTPSRNPTVVAQEVVDSIVGKLL